MDFTITPDGGGVSLPASDIAAAFGSIGVSVAGASTTTTIDAASVTIETGSLTVDFHVLVPEASQTAALSSVNTVQTSTTSFAIDVAGVSVSVTPSVAMTQAVVSATL